MSGIYVPPLRDMHFVLHELLEVEKVLGETCPEVAVDRDTINQILEGAGDLCEHVLAPLNSIGDAHGCSFNEGAVSTPPGFREAYRKYADGGWNGVICDVEDGGQGLPQVIGTAVFEMMAASNCAFSLYPKISEAAYECLRTSAPPELRKTYLKPLATGVWAGTMCLTEPHCGTDLGLLKARAVPKEDGSYAITGTKIFISSGEHDLTENIVHLVLARLPDAPNGTGGISLFVVPKFIPESDGKLGARNSVICGSIEKKMGIHGNSTCVMNFDRATGFLAGEPNRGLSAMFVMMNNARLGTGTQAMGISEVAYQRALNYSRERIQSRAPGRRSSDGSGPIIELPDVRRMLLTQRALVEGGRAFAYWVALQIDQLHHSHDPDFQANLRGQLALLTPVVKAFLSNNGIDVTSSGIQIHGGAGYISETGAEQLLRDARILPIYEGTNGVQANDLLVRKVIGDGGSSMFALLDNLRSDLLELVNSEPRDGADDCCSRMVKPLVEVIEEVRILTAELVESAVSDVYQASASACDYLELAGLLLFGHLWLKSAIISGKKAGDPFYDAKLVTARFYFSHIFPKALTLVVKSKESSSITMDSRAFAP
ncbi:acyl-CoA dehydrogenase family protein [Paraburkholderia sp. C35]|uniref:acyl-CoA dehydrogenase family protein n=1 Tax=Paraburkholderia sp. C35 TaxID=2126993 RepID=UPI000D69B3AE|nr:acyl-CoA dehydrogenase family protein [Paraburkholderia sp. C35]